MYIYIYIYIFVYIFCMSWQANIRMDVVTMDETSERETHTDCGKAQEPFHLEECPERAQFVCTRVCLCVCECVCISVCLFAISCPSVALTVLAESPLVIIGSLISCLSVIWSLRCIHARSLGSVRDIVALFAKHGSLEHGSVCGPSDISGQNEVSFPGRSPAGCPAGVHRSGGLRSDGPQAESHLSQIGERLEGRFRH